MQPNLLQCNPTCCSAASQNAMPLTIASLCYRHVADRKVLVILPCSGSLMHRKHQAGLESTQTQALRHDCTDCQDAQLPFLTISVSHSFGATPRILGCCHLAAFHALSLSWKSVCRLVCRRQAMDEECDGHRVQPEQGCEALPHRLTVLGGRPHPVCIMSAGKLVCLPTRLPICLPVYPSV